MRKPNRRNAQVNAQRIREWVNEYANYRYPVSEHRILDWLGRFGPTNKDLAARVLDSIDMTTHDQIAAAYRSILQGLEGWDRNERRRDGKWRFVAYSASAGESGDSMLRTFRHANNLAGRQFDELFIYRSDILRERLGSNDTVVLVDDFVGSGDQACESWANQFGELLADVGRVYLVVVKACDAAVQRIADETSLEVVPHVYLTKADNVFSSYCRQFNSKEKKALLRFCKKADPRRPKGHGECGLLAVFAHSCPNNSIPVLHKSNKNWEGLFRRYN